MNFTGKNLKVVKTALMVFVSDYEGVRGMEGYVNEAKKLTDRIKLREEIERSRNAEKKD